MARGPRSIRSTRTSQPLPFASSSVVDLRPIKASVEYLPPTHPLRVLLAGERDVLPRDEYAVKMVGWHRLLRMPTG